VPKKKGLTPEEELELLFLLEQEDLEKVSPKIERFREKWRIKLAKGGRAAGAKSWGIASLLIQRANSECLRIGCFREVQKSLEESSYALLTQTIQRLRYPGWRITNEYLQSPSGSHIIFRGLKDIRAAGQVKGLESFDIFWLEEAATISHESIKMILPTLRKDGSELWASYNQETENDPIEERLWNSSREDVLRVWLEPGAIDNPWFPDVLQKEMDEDYARDPDEALHTWGGQPRKQGQRSVMSRSAIRAAMDRDIPKGKPKEIGADIARFGDNKTQIYMREGNKVVLHKEFAKMDTQFIAKEIWQIANQDPSVKIKIDDTGVGGGVTDRLNEFGAKVIPVNFGSSPKYKKKYTSVADELWFNFEVDEADIPNDPELMQELSGRQYSYDTHGRRKVESKDDYKKRLGRSPDKADGLLLCFYEGGSIIMSEENRAALAARRNR